MKRVALLCALLLAATSAPASAQVIESYDFDNPNEGGTNLYGFSYRFSLTQDGGAWSHTHLANGGDEGTGDGAVSVTVNAGEEQFRFGWGTGSISGWTPANGSSVFFRFRMQVTGFGSNNVRVKMFDWENPISNGTDSTSRILGYLANTGNMCGLNFGSDDYPHPGPYVTHHQRPDYGVTGSGDFPNNYIGLSFQRNIEASAGCANPPVMMTTPGNSNRGTPGYTTTQFDTYPGAAATDGWYHIQIELRPGTAGNAYIKQWANHNTYSQPQSLQDPLVYGGLSPNKGDEMGFTVTNWTQGIKVGHYVDVDPGTGGFTYVLDDFEIATTFDPNWYPDGSGETAPDAPTIGTATAGAAQCSVTFTPPADDGGSAITGYTATSSPGGFTGSGGSSPIVVSGLSNGTGYTFTVVATNAEGDSAPSAASNTCTPAAAPSSLPLPLRLKGADLVSADFAAAAALLLLAGHRFRGTRCG